MDAGAGDVAFLSGEPSWSNNLNAPSNTYNTWTADDTAGGTNEIVFYESNFACTSFGWAAPANTMPRLDQLIAGPWTWNAVPSQTSIAGCAGTPNPLTTTINYSTMPILGISIATADPWAGPFTGYMDDLEIQLDHPTITGREDWLRVDFEPFAPANNPIIDKVFAPATILAGGTSTLTFTISHTNDTPLGDINFTDNLPTGLVVANPANVASNTCSGLIYANPGATAISMTGGFLNEASANCSFSVDVTASTANVYANTTNAVTTTTISFPAATGADTASANLTVNAPAIGVSKLALVSGTGPWTVTIAMLVENIGDTTLTDVQVTDDLTFFGTAGTDWVSPPGLSIGAPNGTVVANGGYDGDSDTNLLQAGATLNPGQAINATITVTVNTAGSYNNQATATANGGAVTDLSDDGTNPDTDNDNNANEAGENDPTSIILAAITVTESDGNTAITEGGATDSFTLAATTPPTANVTVNLSPDAQCTVSPNPVILTAGNTTPVTVTVTAVNDAITEGAHNCVITTAAATSSDASYAGINPANVTATVTDNDIAGITVTGVPASVVENVGTFSYTLRLDSEPTSDVVITLGATGCTVPASVTLTSANWDTASNNITATVTDNATAGANPDCVISYTVNAAASANEYDLITEANTTVTVTDNDTAGITVNTAGLVTISEEAVATTTSFTIAANTPPLNDVSVPLTTDGQCTVSPNPVTLTAGNTTAVTVTVTAVNDTTAEATSHNCVITTDDPTSLDGNYDALNAAAVADVTASVLDNEVTFTVTNGGATLSEGTGTNPIVTFTITPSGGGYANVGGTFTYEVADSTSTTTSADFNPAALPSGTLTFLAGGAAQNVTVEIVADGVAEPNFNLRLTTSAQTAGAAGTVSLVGAPNDVAITDDDTAGITITGAPASVVENVGSFSYTLRLDSAPSSDVVITLGATGCTVPASVTLTSANWDTASNNITAIVTDNASVGANPDCVISYTVNAAASADEYDLITEANTSVTVTDDDVPGITLTGVPATLAENVGTFSYRLNLNIPPTGNVTINLGATGCAISSSNPLVLDGSTWNTATNNITVTVTDNATAGANPDCVISYTIDTANTVVEYDTVTQTDSTIPVTDNDVPGLALIGVPVNVAETVGTFTYTLQLNTDPTAAVSIDLSAVGCTVAPTSITLDSSNWDSVIDNISITVTDNASLGANPSCLISYMVDTTASASEYLTVTQADSVIAITDDEQPPAEEAADVVTPTSLPALNPDALLRLLGLAVASSGTGESIAQPNGQVTWTYTLQNISGRTLNEVIATITYPDDEMLGISATSSRGVAGTFRKGSLIAEYALGTLQANEQITLTITTRLPNRAAVYSGTLSASAEGIASAESVTLTLLAVQNLPATGETPAWRDGLLLVLVGALSLMLVTLAYQRGTRQRS